MNRIFLVFNACLGLAIASALPACAETGDVVPAATPPKKESSALPAQPLTARILYTFLLAEIAGARGDLGTSVHAYLDLAQSTRDPRIARRAVEIALFARNMPAATKAARIWVDADPESDEAQRVMAGILAGADGQLEQAQIHLARLLAQSPEQLEAHLMGLNGAFVRVEDKHAVKGIIDRLTEPYLDRPEAQFARAQAALAAGDAAGSLAAIETALDLRPDWEPAILLKAQLLAQSDSTDEAVRLLKSYVDRHPDDHNTRVAYARALVGAGRFADAREEFRSLLADAPDNRDLIYAVGLLSAQLDDFDTAAPLLERALNAGHPEGDGIRLNLGQIAERRGDTDGAIRWYRAVTPGRHYVDAQIRIAALLAQQGKLQQAREHLQSIDAEGDDRKRLRLAEAQLLRSAGQESEAYDVLDAELREAPDDPELLYESSMLAERLDRLDVMEARLRKLIALKPDDAHAYNALGYSLADRGLRLGEAESLIARALELQPDDPFILDSMGWVRFRRGDADGALVHLEKAYRLRADPEIAAHLGEVLWTLNRPADASRIWDEALRAHPDNTLLKSVMQRFATR